MRNQWKLRGKLAFLFLPFVLFFVLMAARPPFDRLLFYKSLSKTQVEVINKQLDLVRKHGPAEEQAYEGALLMRKAGILTDGQQKLELFKHGRSKLENMIERFPENPEYRFLRLLIQENLPPDFPYRQNLSDDARFVKTHYASLHSDVKTVVRKYQKQSPHLKSLVP